VLEICFGTGTTAGAFAAHPALKRLSLVDLNPDVFAMARHFVDANRNVLSDARVERVVDDGRHFLAGGGDKFDVISLEPPPPTAEGASSLYSRDFYALARSRMARGAVLAQWIPLDAQDDALARMLLRSMADAFPEVQLWIPSRLYAVALASDRPLRIDLPRWRQRWAAPEVRESLREVGYDMPEDLAGAFFMGNAAVRRYVEGVAPVTDDRPAIEYFLSTPDRDFDTGALLQASEDPVGVVTGAAPEELIRIEGSARAHRHLVRAHALGRRGEPGLAYDEVLDASDAAGDSPYTEFLEQLEYGCLVKRAR
jgi:spermidine synthase